jgi:hypothetical protein
LTWDTLYDVSSSPSLFGMAAVVPFPADDCRRTHAKRTVLAANLGRRCSSWWRHHRDFDPQWILPSRAMPPVPVDIYPQIQFPDPRDHLVILLNWRSMYHLPRVNDPDCCTRADDNWSDSRAGPGRRSSSSLGRSVIRDRFDYLSATPEPIEDSGGTNMAISLGIDGFTYTCYIRYILARERGRWWIEVGTK